MKRVWIYTVIILILCLNNCCIIGTTLGKPHRECSKVPIKDVRETTFDYLKNLNTEQPVLVILKNGDSLFGIYNDFEILKNDDYGVIYDGFRDNVRYIMNLPLRYDTLLVFMSNTEYPCQMIGLDEKAIVVQPKDFHNITSFKLTHINRIFWVRENRDLCLDTLALLIEDQNCPKMTVIHIFDGKKTSLIPIHDIKHIYKLNVGDATMDFIFNKQGYNKILHSAAHPAENKKVVVISESLKGYKKGFFYGEISGSKQSQINWLCIGGAGGTLFFCLGPLWVGLLANKGEFPANVPEGDADFYKGYTDGYLRATKSKKVQTSCIGGILGGTLLVAFILVGLANMTIPINY